MKVGDHLSFTYNGGRKVRCTVTIVHEKSVVATLHTDYIGKNEEWFSGEDKVFYIKAMKGLKIKSNDN